MTAPIFISYRREDSSPEAISLRDALHRQFGENSVFMDTSSLQAGMVWPDVLRRALAAAKIVLAVIGKNWVGAGDWGQRRLDDNKDWVRQEMTIALKEGKQVVLALVRGAALPPATVLPRPLKTLPNLQAIEIRSTYWDHDVKLLVSQISLEAGPSGESDSSLYPKSNPGQPRPAAVTQDQLQECLERELRCWERRECPISERPGEKRIEIWRNYRFKSFQEAIGFMRQVAQGCDVLMHHPQWENIWKTVTVHLFTWDIDRVSERDLQLARYFDNAYADFPGAAHAETER